VVIKQQLENTLKLVERQGKYLFENLTPIADFRLKCLMEEQNLLRIAGRTVQEA